MSIKGCHRLNLRGRAFVYFAGTVIRSGTLRLIGRTAHPGASRATEAGYQRLERATAEAPHCYECGAHSHESHDGIEERVGHSPMNLHRATRPWRGVAGFHRDIVRVMV